MRAKGAALIWSPRSIIELYGETTDVMAARNKGVKIALAPDWSPTGDTNLLATIAYAKAYSDSVLHGLFASKQLFEMSTSIPAEIARIDHKVGRLKAGLLADLFILKSQNPDPYDALAEAEPR